MANTTHVIEITAGEIAAELQRQGISSDERVTLTISPEPELVPGRKRLMIDLGGRVSVCA